MTTRPRVLLLGASADRYGSDQVLLDIVDALHGSCDLLAVLPANGPLVAELERRGMCPVVVEDYVMRKRNLRVGALLPWVARMVRATRRISAMHRRAPFALVYSNTLAVPIGPWLRIRFRLPHVWHAHEVLEGPTWFRRSMAFALRHGSDVVVCVSNSVRRELLSIDSAIAPKSVVVYNAVDIPERASEPTTSGAVVIGCVGRLYPRKGHLLLLDAISLARRSGTECLLLIFGDPLPGTNFLQEVEEAVDRLGLRDVVTFRGFAACAADIYPEFDVLALPSTQPEAFPLACLEAQAWGLPVIAPNEGGPTEIVVDGVTGILLPPRDAPSLAAAVSLLASQPELRRAMGDAGRQRVAEVFGRREFCHNIRKVVTTESRSARLPRSRQ